MALVLYPILMYHALWPPLDAPDELNRTWAADPQLADPGARLYALDQRQFRRQMQAIVSSGRASPADWAACVRPSAPAAVISFDDGHASNHSLALPVLQQCGLCAIFFITTDWIGAPGFMTEQQLCELRDAGMLLGTHGCSHRYFADLTAAELERELVESKRRLESVLGEEVPAVALPGGRTHPRLRELAAQSGYRYLFTSRIALATGSDDPLDLPRVPITHTQPEAYLERLLANDDTALRRAARNARLRGLAKQIMGNRLYDRLRGALIGK